VLFGGSDGLVWLLSRGEKYCHNGGMAFAPHHRAGYRDRRRRGARPEGSMNGILAPIPDPQETIDLQGRTARGP
jgi:hypothetical protein